MNFLISISTHPLVTTFVISSILKLFSVLESINTEVLYFQGITLNFNQPIEIQYFFDLLKNIVIKDTSNNINNICFSFLEALDTNDNIQVYHGYNPFYSSHRIGFYNFFIQIMNLITVDLAKDYEQNYKHIQENTALKIYFIEGQDFPLETELTGTYLSLAIGLIIYIALYVSNE